MIISAAGFGYQVNWEDEEAPPGHTMSFKRTVETLDTGLLIKLLCPKWLFEWAPTQKIREARDGFVDFHVRQLRTRTLFGALRPRFDTRHIVVPSGDDQRTAVLRRQG